MAFKWYALGNEPERTFEFRCGCCGEVHSGSPSFAYARPFAYFTVPEEERQARVRIDSDTCSVDDAEFYIRSILEVPISGVRDPFTWGVWVSQSRESFERYVATYDTDQSGDGSFGWLAVTMPGYDRCGPKESLEQLACDVTWGLPGERPTIAPRETDHPLYHDYMNGISWDRAIEFARKMMHPGS